MNDKAPDRADVDDKAPNCPDLTPEIIRLEHLEGMLERELYYARLLTELRGEIASIRSSLVVKSLPRRP